MEIKEFFNILDGHEYCSSCGNSLMTDELKKGCECNECLNENNEKDK
jgi:predicted nucleic acid-binding Zn ribbon protein